jgi:hypothetical protein
MIHDGDMTDSMNLISAQISFLVSFCMDTKRLTLREGWIETLSVLTQSSPCRNLASL